MNSNVEGPNHNISDNSHIETTNNSSTKFMKEKHNTRDFEDEIKTEIILDLKDLLLNHPYKEVKNVLKEFYRAWVNTYAEVSVGKEHERTLTIVENLTMFFKKTNKRLKNGD
jgi:hypothetical protein